VRAIVAVLVLCVVSAACDDDDRVAEAEQQAEQDAAVRQICTRAAGGNDELILSSYGSSSVERVNAAFAFVDETSPWADAPHDTLIAECSFLNTGPEPHSIQCGDGPIVSDADGLIAIDVARDGVCAPAPRGS
jgi:hypothetical protein